MTDTTEKRARDLKPGDDLGGWIVESAVKCDSGIAVTIQGGGSMLMDGGKLVRVVKHPAYVTAKVTRPSYQDW
jgi:hypothetical protein